MTKLEIFIYVASVVIMFIALARFYSDASECKSLGGSLVRGALSYECVKGLEVVK